MNKKIIFFILFFLVAFGLYFLKMKSNEKKEEKKTFDFGFSDVAGLHMLSKDEDVFFTNDMEWKVVYPFRESAANDRIFELFNELKKLKVVYEIDNISNIVDYGFNPYIVRLEFLTPDEKKIIDFGFKSVDEKYRYVLYKNKLYVVEGNIEFLFNGFSYFRDRTIFNIPLGEVSKVEIKNKNRNFVIKKENDEYIYNNTVISNFNEKMIDIYSLTVSEFIKGRFNRNPDYIIKVISKAKTNVLWIYDSDIEGSYMARSTEKDGYFTIEIDNLNDIFELKGK